MPHSVPSREQVVDTMIGLTRLSDLHRVIVAGSDSMELYLALRRRGFHPRRHHDDLPYSEAQHAVGLIAGQNAPAAIDAALTQISQFLSASAAIADPDRFPRKRRLPESPQQAAADGLPDRGRCPMPGGPGAVSLSAGFLADGKRGVNSDDRSSQVPPSGSPATSPIFPPRSTKTIESIRRPWRGFANVKSRPAWRRSWSAKPPAKPRL